MKVKDSLHRFYITGFLPPVETCLKFNLWVVVLYCASRTGKAFSISFLYFRELPLDIQTVLVTVVAFMKI